MDADENNSQIGCDQSAKISSIVSADSASYDYVPHVLCQKLFNKAKVTVLQKGNGTKMDLSS